MGHDREVACAPLPAPPGIGVALTGYGWARQTCS